MTCRFALVLVLVAVSGVARAQDLGPVGLTMGYPGSVGVIWQAADRVALRPEFTFSGGSSESSSSSSDVALTGGSSGTRSETWQKGVGLSALFYVTRKDRLRTYITPRFAYSTTSSSADLSGSLASSNFETQSYTTSGSFGVQYNLARHVGMFGEVGLGYTSTNSTQITVETIGGGLPPSVLPGVPLTITLRSDGHSTNIGTRSGAGVILFF
jgi:hypothetical protein